MWCREEAFQIVLVVTALALGVFIVSLPTTILIHGIVPDDAFYYFKVAQNVVRGYGLTFDTINPTNGFQPLWQFLLVPIFYIFREPLMLPVRAVLFLQIGLLALSALLVFRLLRSMQVSITAGFTATMIWVIFPSIFASIVSGLEGALYALLLVYTEWYCVSNFYNVSKPVSLSQRLYLGLLLGLTFLARTEAGLFVLIVLIDLFLHQFRQRKVRHLLDLYPVGLACAILVVPYLAWNLLEYGHPVPLSGRVKAFYAAQERSALAGQGIVALLYGLLREWKSTDPIYEGLEIAVKVVRALFSKLGLPIGIATILVFAAVAFTLWYLRKHLFRKGAQLRPFTPLIAFAGVTFVFYNVYLFGRQRHWYFIPHMLLACMLIALLLDGFFERVKALETPSLRWSLGIFLCLFSLATFAGWLIRLRVSPSFGGTIYPYRYDVAQWLAQNTAEDTRIGVWNAGIVGYFSGRPVINLDGLVNSPAYFRHIKTQTVVDFLEQQEVTFVTDYFDRDPFTKSKLSRYDRMGRWRTHLQLILRIPEEVAEGWSQWYIWRFCSPGSCDE